MGLTRFRLTRQPVRVLWWLLLGWVAPLGITIGRRFAEVSTRSSGLSMHNAWYEFSALVFAPYRAKIDRWLKCCEIKSPKDYFELQQSSRSDLLSLCFLNIDGTGMNTRLGDTSDKDTSEIFARSYP